MYWSSGVALQVRVSRDWIPPERRQSRVLWLIVPDTREFPVFLQNFHDYYSRNHDHDNSY